MKRLLLLSFVISLIASISVINSYAGIFYGWGNNADKQCGQIDVNQSNFPLQADYDYSWTKLVAGKSYALGLKSDGSLWAWGLNWYGQLGLGNTDPYIVPTKLSGATNWVTVSSRDYHTLGIRTNKTLWAWGLNDNGQLGDGTNTIRRLPYTIG